MAAASEQTRRVRYVNANWTSHGSGDGTFELLVVTDDDQRHTVQPSPAAMTALIGLTQASNALLWDPDHQTLIAANLVGDWIPPTNPGPNDPGDPSITGR